jgi:drug/metabolite transporter (DMT)-like permease
MTNTPDKPVVNELPAWQLYGVMLAMLVFGTGTTIIMKTQDDVDVVLPDGTKQKFNHPYFQCALMFFGEFLNLVIYGFKRLCSKEKTQNSSINPLWLMIPTVFDLISTSLMFVALTMVAGSVYQMMRGFIVVITALMAMNFLGRKQYVHHWLSILLIVSGVGFVGYVSTHQAKESGEDQVATTSLQGVLLILFAQCFVGGLFVVEENLLSGTSLDPLFVVGMEGFWGCCFFAILLPIFQQIECTSALCHNGRMEDSLEAFREM